jgi:hypothetical protein
VISNKCLGAPVPGLSTDEHIVLPEGAHTSSVIVAKAWSGAKCGDYGINLQIEAYTVLGDTDKRVC